MKTWLRFAPVTLAGLVVSLPTPSRAEVDFAKEIQPILLKTCIECHGPEKQKGKLRLDSQAEAFKEAAVIVAGKADDSELYKRITLPADHDDIMPNKGDPLTKEQTDLIKAWINEGAKWPEGLVIASETTPKEVDPRTPVTPSDAEKKAIAQLQELGIQVRPVAMNVNWTLANFRGTDAEALDKAMPLLADIQTLEDLNLAGLPVKNDHLKSIAGLKNIIRLHLEKTGVTDDGLAHLQGLENLIYLNLYNTEVSDAGLDHLQGLKRLKNLYLWQTKVSDDGAAKLQAALPTTNINRGWELIAAKQKEEEAKAEEAKKEEEKKAEAEKKEEPAKEEPKAEEKKPEEKKDN